VLAEDPGVQVARRMAVREAFTIPLLCLTVVLVSGFRASPQPGTFYFSVPPLVHLVLAVLVMSVLVRSRVMVPYQLMNDARSRLENIGGGVVLATVFAATATLLSALTPETGLLHLVFVVVIALLLWNTLAARPDPRRALHSLFVTFGAALVVTHVVIASLGATDPSLMKRMLLLLLDGVTLGSVPQAAAPPINGYLAFFATVLYFVAIILLPRSAAVDESVTITRRAQESAAPPAIR
jgi:hypothetical protein